MYNAPELNRTYKVVPSYPIEAMFDDDTEVMFIGKFPFFRTQRGNACKYIIKELG